jgi:hypothetical protein
MYCNMDRLEHRRPQMGWRARMDGSRIQETPDQTPCLHPGVCCAGT